MEKTIPLGNSIFDFAGILIYSGIFSCAELEELVGYLQVYVENNND